MTDEMQNEGAKMQNLKVSTQRAFSALFSARSALVLVVRNF